MVYVRWQSKAWRPAEQDKYHTLTAGDDMSKVYDALVKAEKIYDALIKTKKSDETTKPLSLSWRDIGLDWKIMGTIAGVMFVFALLFLAILNQLRGRALLNQINQKTMLIVTDFSYTTAAHSRGSDAP